MLAYYQKKGLNLEDMTVSYDVIGKKEI